MNRPTKYYSTLQEKNIADYLEWSAVSASGARPFNPGDIITDTWLGECKTHTSIVSRVSIKKSVWKKISHEAKSIIKRPVLFFDNGTQDINNTWCVFQKRFYISDSGSKIVLDIKDSSNQLTFNHEDAITLFSNDDSFSELSIYDESLIITRLSYFKCLFCGGD